MGEMMKCSCRGNNGECHMCFGSGVIEESTLIETIPGSGAPKAAVRQKAPGKQRAPRPDQNSLEVAINRLLGPNRAHDGKMLNSLLELLARRAGSGVIEAAALQALRSTLAKAAMCERQAANSFFIELMREVRQGGQNIRLKLSDINGHIRHGTSARMTEEMVTMLVDARAAQAPKAVKQRVAENANEPRRNASPPRAREAKKRSVVEHLLITAESTIDPQRVQDCSRFIDRHKLKFVYLAGSKKAIRALQAIFTNIDTMPVSNPANVALIRSGPNVAVFDLAPRRVPELVVSGTN